MQSFVLVEITAQTCTSILAGTANLDPFIVTAASDLTQVARRVFCEMLRHLNRFLFVKHRLAPGLMKDHGQQARASENFAGPVYFETPRPELTVHFKKLS